MHQKQFALLTAQMIFTETFKRIYVSRDVQRRRLDILFQKDALTDVQTLYGETSLHKLVSKFALKELTQIPMKNLVDSVIPIAQSVLAIWMTSAIFVG
jgi:hypothetical protein